MNRQEAVEALKKGLSDILDQESFQRFLSLRSRFESYSWHNRLLICMQRPDATLVAGYQRWRQMGRQVRKGEKGIAILAPVLVKGSSSPDDARSEQGEDRTAHPNNDNGDGKENADPRQVNDNAISRLVGFKIVHVFDASQTEGDQPVAELPKPRLLEGENPDGTLWEAFLGFVEARGFRVEDADLEKTNGVTSYPKKLVQINLARSPRQRLKTLAHEAAHVVLHEPPMNPPRSREECETEAEAAAFLVMAHFGLDSSEYSFPYLAGWGTDQKRLVASLARIEGCADELIAAVEAHLVGVPIDEPELAPTPTPKPTPTDLPPAAAA